MTARTDTELLDWLADKLDELRTVSLERTTWEEGSTVEASGPLHSADLGSSEPFPTTHEALRAAINNAMDEEAVDNMRSDEVE